jgi:zinc protease
VEDCRKFHQLEVSPANSTLIIVGAVNPPSLLPLLEKTFGRWEGAPARSRPSWPATGQVEKRGLFLVDKPGAAQSVIQIGRLGAPRLTGDYYALTVLNTMLGGSFTSRLNQNLREKHGYTYGARSQFDFRLEKGPFVASASVQTEVTDKALAEFINELQAIMGDLPELEIQRAKNYIAFSYPSGFQTVGEIAGELSELVEYHLPDTYFNEYNNRILSVTKADVIAAAKKWLDPATVAIVIVGDREKVESGLEALGLGDLSRMSIEQVLGNIPKIPGGQL